MMWDNKLLFDSSLFQQQKFSQKLKKNLLMYVEVIARDISVVF